MSTDTTSDEQIDMKQAIGLLGITQPTFYRWLREGRVHGTKVGRQWRFRRGDIEAVARGETPAGLIPPGLENWNQSLRAAIGAVDGTLPEPGDDPVVDAAGLVLALALARAASDVHLDPDEGGIRLSLRIDGAVSEIQRGGAKLGERLVAAFKGWAHCNIHERELPQDGRIRIDHDGERVDVRLCALPTLFGESLTLRIMDQRAVGLRLDQLRLRDEHLAAIERALAAPSGLVLVTGPAGSGKTTTLYAMLERAMRDGGSKTITIEDPVEFIIPGAVQVPVRNEKGMTIARMLRAALRSAPDQLLVGELRDLDSVKLVHQAALTGHLVLSTLHTQDAPSALRRLRDVGMAPYMIVDAVRLVVAQRLLRRLCPHCAHARELEPTELERVRTWAAEGGLEPESLPADWRREGGCDRCAGGYRGRLAVNQVLPVTGAVAETLVADGDDAALQAAAIDDGVPSLRAEMLRYAAEGATTIEEISRALDG